MTDQGPYRFYDPAKMKGRRSRWIWIGIGLVLAVFIIWLIAPHEAKAPAAGAGAGGGRGGAALGGGGGRRGGGAGGGAPATVGSAQVQKGDAPIYLYALGTATPAQTVTVRTQITGQLLSVGFKEGQMVSKGQFLAQIDPRPYQQALAQAQGTLARDKAQLDNARIDLKRYQTLLAQDSIASQQVDTQAALVRQLEGTIKSDEAAVGAQKLNLTYCHIVSPVSGRVGLRQVDAGNYVSPGDANGIVVVTEVAPIDVLFTVPEDNLPQVAARLRTGAALEAVAFDRTQKVQLAQGKLLTLDNQVDTTTGTIRAKARFDNQNGVLFPNQFVNVRLLVDTLHEAVLAPTAAVLRGSQGLFVWFVQPDKTVTMRAVKTGPAVGENTAITSGLAGGDTVVTDGSDRLREGQRVFLANDCIPAGFGGGRGARGGGAGGKPAGGAAGQAAGGKGGATAATEEPKTLFNLFGLLSPKPKPSTDPTAGLRCRPGQHPASLTASAGSAPGGGQGGGGGGQGGGGGGGRMQALYAQLNLDAGQQAKVDAITAEGRPKMMAAYQSGDMDAAKAARQEMQQKIDAVLRPDQKAKLAELRAQQGGGGGGQGPQ